MEQIKSSSSSNVYNITIYNGKISCDCPAGGRKTFCKHMLDVIKRNKDLIKNTNPAFYKNLQKLIDLKYNHYDSKDEYKDLCNNLLFVNRNISEKAYDNTVVKEKEKKDNKEYYLKLINNYQNETKQLLLEILKALNAYFVSQNKILVEEYLSDFQTFENDKIIICEKTEKIYTISLTKDFQRVARGTYSVLLDELYPKNENGWRIGWDDYWNE